ncbi:MAG TPA: PAS domain-containing protein [Solirubrobacteraceae bacterium]|nr:PAS domain-containing protein [Solirubrobacteraceae bacterium]
MSPIAAIKGTAAFLNGGGALGASMRKKDWSATPLGAPGSWSPSVKIAVNLCLTSQYPILLWIGPQLRILYNDAYAPLLGATKHPRVLGEPGRVAWGEIWPTIGPLLKEAVEGGSAWREDQQFFIDRQLPQEEAYITFSYSPIFSPDGKRVEGIFCPATETTERVLGERRLSTLRALGVRSTEERTVEAACVAMAAVLDDNPLDFPFAAIYVTDEDGAAARRVAVARLSDDLPAFPPTLAIAPRQERRHWPLAAAARTRTPVKVTDLPGTVGELRSPLWPDLVQTGFVLPLGAPSLPTPLGFLIVGASPRRVIDDDYCIFFDLVAEHIATAIADARASEDEHLALARLRGEASERIRRSEARLQAAVELLGLSTYTWDPVTQALNWDDGLRRMWGLSKDAPVDMEAFYAGVHPEDRARVEAAIAASVDPSGEGVYHISYRVIGIEDGIERWVSTHGRTVFDEARRPVNFVGAAYDITEHKQTEARILTLQTALTNELAASSRLHDLSVRLTAPTSLSALLDEALSAVMELQRADFGIVQLFNNENATLSIVAHRGVGEDFLEHFRTVDASDASAGGSALKSGERILIENVDEDQRYAEHRPIARATGYRATQSTPMFDRARGRPVGMLSTLFRQPYRPSERELRLTDLYAQQAADVISAKLAEQRLRGSEARFQVFAKYSADVLWMMDAEAMRLEFLSSAFERVWGGPPSETLTDMALWTETIHRDDRAGALDALDRIRRGEVVVQEYRILRPDGAVRWIRNTGFPIPDEEGRVLRIGGISQDITKHESSTVYFIDGRAEPRRALAVALREAGYAVREFASARAFLEVAAALQPGCVLVDLRSTEDGLTIPKVLQSRQIALPIVVLGKNEGEIAAAVQAMKAGAVDYLDSPVAFAALLEAVASALAEVREAMEADRSLDFARARISGMSMREHEVLEGLVAGETNKLIGRRLGISPRTVEVHRAHLMERLDVRSLPELVLLAAAAARR